MCVCVGVYVVHTYAFFRQPSSAAKEGRVAEQVENAARYAIVWHKVESQANFF